jgi:hypothetical protein
VAVDSDDDGSLDQRVDVYAIGGQLMWFAAVASTAASGSTDATSTHRVWRATGMARVSFSHFCDDPSCS